MWWKTGARKIATCSKYRNEVEMHDRKEAESKINPLMPNHHLKEQYDFLNKNLHNWNNLSKPLKNFSCYISQIMILADLFVIQIVIKKVALFFLTPYHYWVEIGMCNCILHQSFFLDNIKKFFFLITDNLKDVQLLLLVCISSLAVQRNFTQVVTSNCVCWCHFSMRHLSLDSEI